MGSPTAITWNLFSSFIGVNSIGSATIVNTRHAVASGDGTQFAFHLYFSNAGNSGRAIQSYTRIGTDRLPTSSIFSFYPSTLGSFGLYRNVASPANVYTNNFFVGMPYTNNGFYVFGGKDVNGEIATATTFTKLFIAPNASGNTTLPVFSTILSTVIDRGLGPQNWADVEVRNFILSGDGQSALIQFSALGAGVPYYGSTLKWHYATIGYNPPSFTMQFELSSINRSLRQWGAYSGARLSFDGTYMLIGSASTFGNGNPTPTRFNTFGLVHILKVNKTTTPFTYTTLQTLGSGARASYFGNAAMEPYSGMFFAAGYNFNIQNAGDGFAGLHNQGQATTYGILLNHMAMDSNCDSIAVLDHSQGASGGIPEGTPALNGSVFVYRRIADGVDSWIGDSISGYSTFLIGNNGGGASVSTLNFFSTNSILGLGVYQLYNADPPIFYGAGQWQYSTIISFNTRGPGIDMSLDGLRIIGGSAFATGSFFYVKRRNNFSPYLYTYHTNSHTNVPSRTTIAGDRFNPKLIGGYNSFEGILTYDNPRIIQLMNSAPTIPTNNSTFRISSAYGLSQGTFPRNSPFGHAVTDIIQTMGNNYVDPNNVAGYPTTPDRGIAIISSPSNIFGFWTWGSTNSRLIAPQVWTPISGGTTSTNAFLVPEVQFDQFNNPTFYYLRFSSIINSTATTFLHLKAWDQTNGDGSFSTSGEALTYINTIGRMGGFSSISLNNAIAFMSVIRLNNTPVITDYPILPLSSVGGEGTNLALTGITTAQISTILSNAYFDADIPTISIDRVGFAVISTANYSPIQDFGRWQVSTSALTWSNLSPSTSYSTAFLLPISTQVWLRFSPFNRIMSPLSNVLNSTALFSLTLAPWDQTRGTALTYYTNQDDAGNTGAPANVIGSAIGATSTLLLLSTVRVPRFGSFSTNASTIIATKIGEADFYTYTIDEIITQFGSLYDPYDLTARRGLLVYHANNNTAGAWEFSTSWMSAWSTLNPQSTSAIFLSGSNSFVRFNAVTNTPSNSWFTCVPWNQETFANYSTVDITLPISYSTSYASFTSSGRVLAVIIGSNFRPGVAVNTPPVLMSSVFGVGRNTDDGTTNIYGFPIQGVIQRLGANYVESDTAANIRAIALQTLPQQAGTWYYNSSFNVFDPNANWQLLPTTLHSSFVFTMNPASNSRIALLPNINYTSTYTVRACLWDGTDRAPSFSTVDISRLNSLENVSSPYSWSSISLQLPSIYLQRAPSFTPNITSTLGTQFARPEYAQTFNLSSLISQHAAIYNDPDIYQFVRYTGFKAGQDRFTATAVNNYSTTYSSIVDFRSFYGVTNYPGNDRGKLGTITLQWIARYNTGWQNVGVIVSPDGGSNWFRSLSSMSLGGNDFVFQNPSNATEFTYGNKSLDYDPYTSTFFAWNFYTGDNPSLNVIRNSNGQQVRSTFFFTNDGFNWSGVNVLYFGQQILCRTMAWTDEFAPTRTYLMAGQNAVTGFFNFFTTTTPFVASSWQLQQTIVGDSQNFSTQTPTSLNYTGYGWVYTTNNGMPLHTLRGNWSWSNIFGFYAMGAWARQPSTGTIVVRNLSNVFPVRPSLFYAELNTTTGNFVRAGINPVFQSVSFIPSPATTAASNFKGVIWDSVNNYFVTINQDGDIYTSELGLVFTRAALGSIVNVSPVNMDVNWFFNGTRQGSDGIAITNISQPNALFGDWQVFKPSLGWQSLANQPLGFVSSFIVEAIYSNAIRYVPLCNSTFSASITFAAWNALTVPTASTLNITLPSYSTSFTSTTVTFTIQNERIVFPPFFSSLSTFSTYTLSSFQVFATGFNTIDNTERLFGYPMTDFDSVIISTFPQEYSGYVLTRAPTEVGTWYYTSSFSIVNPQWQTLPTSFSPSTSLTLNIAPSTRLAFIPFSDITSTYSITMRLWNESDNVPILSTVDTSFLDSLDPFYQPRYLSTPYSRSSITFQVRAIAINDRPRVTLDPLSTVSVGTQYATLGAPIDAISISSLVGNVVNYTTQRKTWIDQNDNDRNSFYILAGTTNTATTQNIFYRTNRLFLAISTPMNTNPSFFFNPQNGNPTRFLNANIVRGSHTFVLTTMVNLNNSCNTVANWSYNGSNWYAGRTVLPGYTGTFCNNNVIVPEVKYFSENDIFIACITPYQNNQNLTPTYAFSQNGGLDWVQIWLPGSTIGTTPRGTYNHRCSTMFHSITYMSNAADPYYVALGGWYRNHATNDFESWNDVYGVLLYRTKTPWLSSTWEGIPLPAPMQLSTFTDRSSKYTLTWLGQDFIIGGRTSNLAYIFSTMSTGRILQTRSLSTMIPAIDGNEPFGLSFTTNPSLTYGILNTWDSWQVWGAPIINGTLSTNGLVFSSIFDTRSNTTPITNTQYHSFTSWDFDRFLTVSMNQGNPRIYEHNSTFISTYLLANPPNWQSWTTHLFPFHFSAYKGLIITQAPSNALGYWQISTPIFREFASQPWNRTVPTTGAGGWSTLFIPPSTGLTVLDTNLVYFRWFPTSNVNSFQTLRALPYDWTQFTDLTFINLSTTQNLSSPYSTTTITFSLQLDQLISPPFLSSAATANRSTIQISSVWATGYNILDNTSNIIGNSTRDIHNIMSNFYFDLDNNRPAYVLTDLPTRAGIWYLTSTITGPLQWSPFPSSFTASTSFTLNINPSTRIGLVAAVDVLSTYTVTMRAWSGTDTIPFFSTVDTSWMLTNPPGAPRYVSSPYSLSTFNLRITTLPVNAQPIFTISQTSTLFLGNTLANFIGTTSNNSGFDPSTFYGTLQSTFGPTSFIDADAVDTKYLYLAAGNGQVAFQFQNNISAISTFVSTAISGTLIPSATQTTLTNSMQIQKLPFVRGKNIILNAGANPVHFSLDGRTWAPTRLDTGGANLFDIKYFDRDNLWVFTGLQGTRCFTYWYSSNAIDWTPVSLTSTVASATRSTFFTSITYASNLSPPEYVALASFGTTSNGILDTNRGFAIYKTPTPWISSSWSTLSLPATIPITTGTLYTTIQTWYMYYTGNSWLIYNQRNVTTTDYMVYQLYSTFTTGRNLGTGAYSPSITQSAWNNLILTPTRGFLNSYNPTTMFYFELQNGNISSFGTSGTTFFSSIGTGPGNVSYDGNVILGQNRAIYPATLCNYAMTINTGSIASLSGLGAFTWSSLRGFAITAAPSTSLGVWQISSPLVTIPGGWSTLTNISPTNALLIPEVDVVSIRFFNFQNITSTASMTVIPWDQTQFFPFTLVNTTLQNFSSPFSTTTLTLTVSTLFTPAPPIFSTPTNIATTFSGSSIWGTGANRFDNTSIVYGDSIQRFIQLLSSVSSILNTNPISYSTSLAIQTARGEGIWYWTSSFSTVAFNSPDFLQIWRPLPITLGDSNLFLFDSNADARIAVLPTVDRTQMFEFSARLWFDMDGSLRPYSTVNVQYLSTPQLFDPRFVSSPFSFSTVSFTISCIDVNVSPAVSSGLNIFLSSFFGLPQFSPEFNTLDLANRISTNYTDADLNLSTYIGLRGGPNSFIQFAVSTLQYSTLQTPFVNPLNSTMNSALFATDGFTFVAFTNQDPSPIATNIATPSSIISYSYDGLNWRSVVERGSLTSGSPTLTRTAFFASTIRSFMFIPQSTAQYTIKGSLTSLPQSFLASPDGINWSSIVLYSTSVTGIPLTNFPLEPYWAAAREDLVDPHVLLLGYFGVTNPRVRFYRSATPWIQSSWSTLNINLAAVTQGNYRALDKFIWSPLTSNWFVLGTNDGTNGAFFALPSNYTTITNCNIGYGSVAYNGDIALTPNGSNLIYTHGNTATQNLRWHRITPGVLTTTLSNGVLSNSATALQVMCNSANNGHRFFWDSNLNAFFVNTGSLTNTITGAVNPYFRSDSGGSNWFFVSSIGQPQGTAGNFTAQTSVFRSTFNKGFLFTDVQRSQTGYWQFYIPEFGYSTITATSNAAFPVVAHPAFKVQFIPTANIESTYTIKYVAWDGTQGTSGTPIDVTVPYTFSSAWTSLTAEFTVSTTRYVFPPSISSFNSSFSLSTVRADGVSTPVIVISTLANFLSSVGLYRDGVIGDVRGLAINSNSGSFLHGVWQASTSGLPTEWSTLGPASDAAAITLGPAVQLRFSSLLNVTSTFFIGFKAWNTNDFPVLSPLALLNTVPQPTAGNTYSASSIIMWVSTFRVNVAPSLPQNTNYFLSTTFADASYFTTYRIQDFSTILSTNFFDQDALRGYQKTPGILITSLQSGATGLWQISSPLIPTTTWSTLSNISPTNALVLSFTASTSIRFLPTSNIPSSFALQFRAWTSFQFDNFSTVNISAFPTFGQSTTFSLFTNSFILSSVRVNAKPALPTDTLVIQQSSFFADTVAPQGFSVKSLVDWLGTNYIDANTTLSVNPNPKGVALVFAPFTDTGFFEFSTPTSGWAPIITPFPLSTNKALVLLNDATNTNRIRFTPITFCNYTSTYTLKFRLWNQTDGIANGSQSVDTSYADPPTANFSTAYSFSTFTVFFSTLFINHAPTLPSTMSYSLPLVTGTYVPYTFNTSFVSSLVGSNMTDYDAAIGQQTGFALVRRTTSTLGIWQISSPFIPGNPESGWSTLGLISTNNALLLDISPSTSLRWFITSNITISTVLEFLPWDRTQYSLGQTVNITDAVTGGSTSFAVIRSSILINQRSAQTNTSPFLLSNTLQVSAPTIYTTGYNLDGTLPTRPISTFQISTLLGSNYGEVDIPSEYGLALVWASQQPEGQWMFSLQNQTPPVFSTIQPTISTNSAILFAFSTGISLYFSTAANQNIPTNPSLKFRLWDQTNGLSSGTVFDTSFADDPPADYFWSTSISQSTFTLTLSTVRFNFRPEISSAVTVPLPIAPLGDPFYIESYPVSILSTAISTLYIDVDPTHILTGRGFAIYSTISPTIPASTGTYFDLQFQTPLNPTSWFTMSTLSTGNAFLVPATTDPSVRFRIFTNYNSTIQVGFQAIAWDQTQYTPYTPISLISTGTGVLSPFSELASTMFFTFPIVHVNHSPVILSTSVYAASSFFSLSNTPIQADSGAYGTSVTDIFTIISTNFADPDEITTQDRKGIAIVGATNDTRGMWYWGSTVQGNNVPFLNPFPTNLATNAAFLLTSNTSNRVRFIPYINSTFTATITFRAWDQTDNYLNAYSNVDTSFMDVPIANPSTAYSASTATLTFQAFQYPLAPVISSGASAVLSNVAGNDPSPPGLPISQVLQAYQPSSVFPVDRDIPGLVITNVLSTVMGRWQISTPQTAGWSTLHIPTDAQAGLFLTSNANNLVRFVPFYNSNSTVSLQFRLWNQRLFANLSTAVTQFSALPNEFLSTTYSYSTAVLYFSVSHINHAPFLTNTGAIVGMRDAYFEDPAYGGNTVRQLIDALSTNYTEIDEGDRRGFAVVGTTVGFGGQWEMSSVTQPWNALPSPLSDSSALLLSSLTTTSLRFSTALNQTFVATLLLRLWDGYDGFPDATYPYAITATGGNTSYSPTYVSAITQVFRVNHAPVLQPNIQLQASTVFADSAYQSPIPAITTASILNYLVVNSAYTEIDGDPYGIGITFAQSTATGTWQVTNQFGAANPTWTSIHTLSTTSTFVMASNSGFGIRFYSYSNIASTYSLQFRGWDSTNPTTGYTYATLSTVGGSNSLSLSTATLFISTLLVNHAPILQANTIAYASSIVPFDPINVIQYPPLSVSSLIQLLTASGRATDTNGDSLGIAVTFANAGAVAQWQISPGDPNIYTDQTSFQPFPITNAATQTYLLTSSVRLRLLPSTTLNITSSFSLRYRLWDMTTDSPYATVNTTSASATGLSTAYSINEGTLILSTLRMNTPPILTIPQLEVYGSTIRGAVATNPGHSMTDVSTFISTNLTLTNPLTDTLGFAWFGLTSNTAGYWQISSPVFTTSPNGWSTILTTQSPASVYLVPATQSVRIRFVPTQNITATRTANFYAWNQQQLFPYSFVTPPAPNLSTPVSQNFNTLVISTQYLNYAPSVNTAVYTYGPFSGLNVGNDGITIQQLLTDNKAFDLNGDALGIALTGYSTIQSLPFTPTAAIQTSPDTIPYNWQTIYSTPTDGTIGTQAYTIPPNSRIRISSYSNTQGGFLLNTFAWDQTLGTPFSFTSIATLQTAEPQYGSLSYNSNANRQLSSMTQMNVAFVFFAPQLLNDITLSSINAFPSTNLGYNMSTIISTLGDKYIDSNFGQFGTGRGLAVFDVNPPTGSLGRWEFTTNNWTSFTEISTNWNLQISSYVLKGSGLFSTQNAIRFRPSRNNTQQVRFSFFAWDERFYANGSFVQISTNLQGGQSTFSVSSATAYFSTLQVYFAPSTTNASVDFGSFYADNTNNPAFGPLASEGFLLRNILANAAYQYTDPNVGSGPLAGNDTRLNTRGMAVVGTTGIRGQWMYTPDAITWYDLNVTSPSTFLLPETAYIKFSSFSNETKQATVQWAAWSRFKYQDFTYVSSLVAATGPNQPFSPPVSLLYPTLLCNLTRINLPPTIAQGSVIYDISAFYTVSFDNSDNFGFDLTQILTHPAVNYFDPYNLLRGIVLTPLPFTYRRDNSSALVNIGGAFSNNLTTQTTPTPQSSLVGVPVIANSMLLFSTPTLNPKIYFTVSNDRPNFNINNGKAGFTIRGFNGCNVDNVEQAATNGSVYGPLPPFNIHGAFSQNTITFVFSVTPAVNVPQFTSNIPISIPNIFENTSNSVYLTVPMMSTAITTVAPEDPLQVGYFVAAADSTNGRWFFTLDNGVTSNAFAIGPRDILHLGAGDGAGVKFVPSGNYVGSASVRFGIYNNTQVPFSAGNTATNVSRGTSQRRYSVTDNDFIVTQSVSRYISPSYPIAIFLSTFSDSPSYAVALTRGINLTGGGYARSQRIHALTRFILQQQADSTQYSYNFTDYDEFVSFQIGLRELGYLDNVTRSTLTNPAPGPTYVP